MSSTELRIVVAVDFSETSLEALRYAYDEAAHRWAERPRIHAVVVIDDGTSAIGRRRHEGLDGVVDRTFEEMTRLLQSTRQARLGDGPEAPSIPATIHVRLGDPVDQIVGVATEVAAHLVLVGTHGRRGVRRLVLGSVAERVARMAPCPVIVVRPRDLAAFAAVPVPEPAPPGGVTDGPTELAHRYEYSSALSAQPPPNHLL